MAAESGTVYFWGNKSPFSNFYVCREPFAMTIEFAPGVRETFRFLTSEQAFMYSKAAFFKDHSACIEVLRAKTAKEAKAIGRRVRGFDEERWTAARWPIMYACVTAKFRGCAEARAAMEANGDARYAEASPYDRIWGIGYRAREAPAHEEDWGLNLLGKILGAVAEARRTGSDSGGVLLLHSL